MYSAVKHLRENRSGYTLVDALLQLMVLLLFSQLFVLFYPWYEDTNRSFYQRQELEWELFTYDLQTYLVDVESVEIGLSVSLHIVKDDRYLSIRNSNAVVRMQKEMQGNEAMLMNVYEIQFYFSDDRTTLTTKVLFKDGLRKEKDFVITYVEG
ncbi:ComGF family competence protein [Viridibacillus sp. YIM B01967]|uniref:ComGF family competence protein n=1 Tax=Viridibacillus soli TaxID=2798301 RepID=A0ABS1H3N4_9BACL|nr:competence type IV pilus minor pilin ComGF [Viridibacillus soli]MBK3494011.1 ComGF family competence protein [Viridibacillus soli]